MSWHTFILLKSSKVNKIKWEKIYKIYFYVGLKNELLECIDFCEYGTLSVRLECLVVAHYYFLRC